MKPCVVIGSSDNEGFPPNKIVKGILEVAPENELIPSSSRIEGVATFPWLIRNKYYEAEINICTLNSKTIGDKEFADSVNAVILYFDAESSAGLASVEQWLPFTNEFDAEIKILVCERCCETQDRITISATATQKPDQDRTIPGVEKLAAQTWCVNYGFELVELDPVPDDDKDNETEDDFPETLGMKRVIQALHAHMWPNLKLIDCKLPRIHNHSEASEEIQAGKEDNCESPNKSEDGKVPVAETTRSAIDSLLQEDTSNESEKFENLFEQLNEMKLRAESMGFEERKAYAEKMAIAFWKSTGGNDSEIEGLSSDEELEQ